MDRDTADRMRAGTEPADNLRRRNDTADRMRAGTEPAENLAQINGAVTPAESVAFLMQRLRQDRPPMSPEEWMAQNEPKPAPAPAPGPGVPPGYAATMSYMTGPPVQAGPEARRAMGGMAPGPRPFNDAQLGIMSPMQAAPSPAYAPAVGPMNAMRDAGADLLAPLGYGQATSRMGAR